MHSRRPPAAAAGGGTSGLGCRPKELALCSWAGLGHGQAKAMRPISNEHEASASAATTQTPREALAAHLKQREVGVPGVTRNRKGGGKLPKEWAGKQLAAHLEQR